MKTPTNSENRHGRTPENRANARKRRAEIARRAELFGILSLNKTVLASEFNRDYKVICKDIEYVVAHWKGLKVPVLKVDLESRYIIGLKKAGLLMHRQKGDGETQLDVDRLRLSATRAVSQLGKDFTSFLESYGVKEKVDSNVHLNVDVEESATRRIVKELLSGSVERLEKKEKADESN